MILELLKKLKAITENLVTLPPYKAEPKLKIFRGDCEETPSIRIFREEE